MRKTLVAVAIVALLGLSVTLTAVAQQRPPGQPPGAPPPAAQPAQPERPAWTPDMGMIESKNLIGAKVRDAQGQALGSVNQLIFDTDGKLSYVVVGIGGVLGIGQTEVAIPWTDVQVSGDDRAVAVTLDRTTLDQAPRYEPRPAPAASPRTQ